MTIDDVAEILRKYLNDTWQIHVAEITERQIPDGKRIRRAKTVKSIRVYISTFKPVYITVFLNAETITQAVSKIASGELARLIEDEFRKNSINPVYVMEPEKLSAEQRGIGQKQLALTHNPTN